MRVRGLGWVMVGLYPREILIEQNRNNAKGPLSGFLGAPPRKDALLAWMR